MFGQNSVAPVISQGGNKLDVVDIFSTIQGEGPYSGTPAIFLRLGGCNLQCKFCDTDFEEYDNISLENIVSKIIALRKKHPSNLIVITGGEPLRQPIEILCQKLLDLNFKIQIESNGTIFRKLPVEIEIVCSPKITNNKYHITPRLIDYVTYFKFLVEKNGAYNILPDIDLVKPVYIQPIDTYDKKTNAENLNYAIDLALKNNYILTIQMHKIINMP